MDEVEHLVVVAKPFGVIHPHCSGGAFFEGHGGRVVLRGPRQV
jgi:hypothetical protein